MSASQLHTKKRLVKSIMLVLGVPFTRSKTYINIILNLNSIKLLEQPKLYLYGPVSWLIMGSSEEQTIYSGYITGLNNLI